MAFELKKGVYWVGVIDWGIHNFHGHELSVHRGTTYNSYLIVDEKIALIDTVMAPFQKQLLENVLEIVDPSRIDYVIANHAEPDHSGGLVGVIHYAKNAVIIASQRGEESVKGHYHQPWNFKPVKTGDKISLGKNELFFFEAPMLHWPDSMFTYLTGHNILMPNDAFGQHYATAFRFNDQVNQEELYEEAVKYYANIINPYSRLVTQKINELLSLNLDIDMIAPSHGVIWRKDPMQIVQKYQEWALQKPEKRAVVLYDTMWEATSRMAQAVGNGLASKDVDYKLFHMALADRNDVITEIFKSKAIVIGSPTLNQGLLPTIAPILEDIKGLRFQNKIGAAFGSYGWSGDSVKIIQEHFKKCGIPIVAEGVLAKWQPRVSDLKKCEELGQKVADAIRRE